MARRWRTWCTGARAGPEAVRRWAASGVSCITCSARPSRARPTRLPLSQQRWARGSSQNDPGRHPFRIPFGELQLGDSFNSAERAITVEDIEQFAALTGDTYYAHMSESEAARNPLFGGRVAHGYFLISAAAGLFVDPDYGPVLGNYGLDNLRFVKPVRPGDSIRVRLTCMEKTLRPEKGWGEVSWDTEIRNQNGETVASYNVLTMVSVDAIPDARSGVLDMASIDLERYQTGLPQPRFRGTGGPRARNRDYPSTARRTPPMPRRIANWLTSGGRSMPTPKRARYWCEGPVQIFPPAATMRLIERMIADEATLLRVWKEASDLVYNLVNCSKPVVAAVRGSAVGAGLAIALLADVSIAATDAKILDGHTRLGVAAGDHAVMIWPLLCGLAKARYHLLTNRPLSGAEAERIGLIAVCVNDSEVLATALDTCRELAAGSASAIHFTKHALNNWLRLAGPSFDASLALEFLGFRLSDAREGIEAARAKRRPSFKGPST